MIEFVLLVSLRLSANPFLARAYVATPGIKPVGQAAMPDFATREIGYRREIARLEAEAAKLQKPALPPDEARDRQIKGLKTTNQNLRGKLRYMEQHYQEAIALAGGMTRETQNAIDWVLQPDQRDNATTAVASAASAMRCASVSPAMEEPSPA